MNEAWNKPGKLDIKKALLTVVVCIRMLGEETMAVDIGEVSVTPKSALKTFMLSPSSKEKNTRIGKRH